MLHREVLKISGYFDIFDCLKSVILFVKRIYQYDEKASDSLSSDEDHSIINIFHYEKLPIDFCKARTGERINYYSKVLLLW